MKKAYLLAACAVASISYSANALTLVSAAVFGSVNSTVWGTANAPGTSAGNYTLFLQNPGLGNFINPNDEAVNVAVQPGTNYAFLSGDGYFPGQTGNSDPLYNLRLTFDDGSTLTGSYVPGSANLFVAGAPVRSGNTVLTLNEFSFTRSLANTVGQYNAVPGTGDGNDYAGNFRFTSATVPEPASWALMLGGFGLVGAGIRRRKPSIAVTYA